MQTKSFFTQTRWLVTIILLTTLGIGNALGANIVIDLDLSDGNTYPNDFPTATGTTSGSHTLGGYTFTFSCNTGYYKGSQNAYLMIGACNTTEATASIITFPAIANYKLTEVILTTTSGGSTALSLWVGTGFSSALSGGGAWTYAQSTSKTWTLTGTSANTAYKLYAKRSGSSGTKNCQIAGLKLTYEPTAACSADVGIGTASLNGTFNLSSVGVQCASITPGSNCAVAANNYGFIWYQGSAADKKIGDSGVTRVNNSTAYSSGTFSNTLSSTFVAGTTYTFRAFATNDKPSTAYSAEVSFTPYTVTFNMNGHGSAPSQQVVNTGGTASTPSAPSATGYTFGGWYQEAGCTNSWNFSTTITSSNTTSGNRNLYAKWTAKEYAITLNGNSATSAGSPASVNATYNSSSLSSAITNPSRTGYTFGGWNTKDDGTGLTVINTSGNLVASQSGYTDGSGNWTKDGTAALYAKWTAKSFDVTWMVNGEEYTPSGSGGTDGSSSVNFGTHVTTLPTAPTPPCGNKFMGWTTTNIGSTGLDKTDDAAAITALNLFTTAGDAPVISAEGDVTYYAVFADYAE